MEKNKNRTLLLFCIGFYLFWSCIEGVVVPFLDQVTANEIVNTFLVDVVIKNLSWTVPAVWLLHKYSECMYVKPQKIFSLQRNQAKWLLVIPVVMAYAFALAIREQGEIKISDGFGVPSILVVLFVGITEETVFRGLLLNATYSEKHKAAAILVNALMFLAIHFPKWLQTGSFLAVFSSLGFLTILFLSIVFSILFIKSKSLLIPIIAHSIYDLFIMMLC